MAPASEPPIACSLQGARYRDRIAANKVLARSLIDRQRDGRTLTLTYPVAVAADVQRMAAAERECCAFLEFAVNVSHDRITLVITVPARAEAVADDVFAQFVPDGEAPPGNGAEC